MGKRRYRLEDSFLFAIDSPADLARRLEVDSSRLDSLAKDEGNFKLYNHRKTGRPIQEPRRELQKAHARIHKLLSRVKSPDYLHSTKGRSYITNARAHQVAGPTIKLDIKKFFRSVPRAAVFRFFHEQMRCKRDVAGLLANILTIHGHLATGSSASPVIAYYTYQSMFDELEALARRNGLVMTAYVDDITMTGPGASERVLHEARQIVKRHGLRSHKAMHLKRPGPKLVTGVIVGVDGVRLPNVRQQKIRAGHAALRAAATPIEEKAALDKLVSRVNEAAQIDPAGYQMKALELQRRKAQLRDIVREKARF